MTSNVLHNVGCQAIIGFWTSYLTRDEPPRISLTLVVMNYVQRRKRVLRQCLWQRIGVMKLINDCAANSTMKIPIYNVITRRVGFEFAIHKMKPRFARTFTDKLRGTKTMLLGGRPALDLVCRHVVHEHRSLTWHKGLLHDKGGQKGGRDDDARGL